MYNATEAIKKIKSFDEIFDEVSKYFNDGSPGSNYKITKKPESCSSIYPEFEIKKHNTSLCISCPEVYSYSDSDSQYIIIKYQLSMQTPKVFINKCKDYLYNLKILFNEIENCEIYFDSLYLQSIDKFLDNSEIELLFDDQNQTIFIKNQLNNTIITLKPRIDMIFEYGIAKLSIIVKRDNIYYPYVWDYVEEDVYELYNIIEFFL